MGQNWVTTSFMKKYLNHQLIKDMQKKEKERQ
jgi:hypothetical protein